MKRVKQKQPVPNWRFYFVVALLVALPVALVSRMASLQVLNGDRGVEFLQKQGNARAVRVMAVNATRGMITDRNGQPLAVSTPVVSLWADPATLREEDLASLAKALHQSEAALRKRLAAYAGKRFMYLARRLPPARAAQVSELRIKGVHEQREYQRFYPAGAYAAQLVGIVNVDDEGISGLELAYDDWLRGAPGKRKVVISGKLDKRGRRVNEVVSVIGELAPVQPGKDLRLSIDLRLQYVQYRELARAVRETGASSGSAVTLDVDTGEVLAVNSYPSFNPNNRRSISKHLKAGDTRNRVFTDVLEPGSTVKTLSVAAALESGQYTIDSVIDTAPGEIVVAGKRIADPRNYGELSLARVLAKSSQVGTARLALDLGVDPIWEMFNRFGLGQSTGSGFPGERAGALRVKDKWYLTEQVTLAYGYGLTATPLQLARAYAAIAKDGELMPVSLLARRDDVEVHGEQIIDKAIASDLRDALAAVVKGDGTATRAAVPGFAVGGKTGTARKLGKTGYRDDSHFALFAGLAPIDNPKIVTVVLIDDPQGEEYGGGAVAAPVFSRIAAGVLPLLSVPFDDRALLAAAGDAQLGEAM
ncbi:MAG: cell division protein [Gammaproteobacteria bacterium]|nr:MAG: cell division protein [Gammaproteobacteria bacterium]